MDVHTIMINLICSPFITYRVKFRCTTCLWRDDTQSPHSLYCLLYILIYSDLRLITVAYFFMRVHIHVVCKSMTLHASTVCYVCDRCKTKPTGDCGWARYSPSPTHRLRRRSNVLSNVPWWLNIGYKQHSHYKGIPVALLCVNVRPCLRKTW